MSLKPHEVSLVAQVGFDPEAAELFQAATRSQLNPFYQGVAARVIDGEAAETIMKAVQPQLLQRGYRAFWTHFAVRTV